MKMFFIIYILHLISGPGCDSEVLGYSGGSILILSGLQWDTNRTRSVCRVEQSECVYLMKDQTRSNDVSEGRLKMYSHKEGELVFVMRNLTTQDSGVYRCGVGEEKGADIELLVKTDDCCGGRERKTVFLGENITMSCNYPPEFTNNSKRLISFNDQNIIKDIIYTEKDSQKVQKGRFSIFDDRSSKVVRVELSDVREDDRAAYSCGSWKKDKSVRYSSYFKEIHLLAPAHSVLVIITVCVCVILLLIAGIALTLKLRNTKRNNSNSALRCTNKNKVACPLISDGDDCGPQDHAPNTNESDPIYENFDISSN